jgi:hypothetical protein
MVGRGASLDGYLFLGGTDGSNPVLSSGESGANLSLAGIRLSRQISPLPEDRAVRRTFSGYLVSPNIVLTGRFNEGFLLRRLQAELFSHHIVL